MYVNVNQSSKSEGLTAKQRSETYDKSVNLKKLQIQMLILWRLMTSCDLFQIVVFL